MVESPDPAGADAVAWARPVDGVVPIARPIGYPALGRPMVCPMPGRRPRRNEAFLLGVSSAGAAWADVARLIVYVVLLEMVTECMIELAVPVPAEAMAWDAEAVEAALDRALVLPLLTVRATVCVGIVAAILWYRRQPRATIGLLRAGLGMDLLLGLGSTVGVYGVTVFTMGFLWLVWPGMWQQMQENAERLVGLLPRLHPLMFGAVAIAVGVYEEVLFRGFLMTRLRRGTGSWTAAVVLSTALFTALHAMEQTTAALIAITALSLVFSLVTIWRRSIIPAIVGHALFDWSQFLILSFEAGDSWT